MLFPNHNIVKQIQEIKTIYWYYHTEHHAALIIMSDNHAQISTAWKSKDQAGHRYWRGKICTALLMLCVKTFIHLQKT